tara:strand:- start:62516 stop:64684 length:2169 start_codon:yes stop_codon:yes gene_type:complete
MKLLAMKTICTLFLVFFVLYTNAQTTISGKVTDKKQQPIAGANVYLENTYDGATSEADGTFTFKTTETGQVTLVVSYLAYKTFKQEADVTSLNNLIIVLTEEVNTLDAVVLTAGSFQAGDNTKVSVMNALDVVTTAGVAGDFISALQTLPGTQTVGEDGRLFVRGGTAEETQVFIDGLQVFKPYSPTSNNTPTRGRYSPFLFDGITFSTGGYSAEYGNALSSVLLLNTIDHPEQSETNISLMSLGVGLGHTKKWEKDALTFSAAYINLAPYNKLVPDTNKWNKLPESISGETVYRHDTKNGLFKLYSAFDVVKFDVEQPAINYEDLVRFDLQNNNWYTNASYEGFVGDKMVLTSGISYSNSYTKLAIEDTDVTDRENAVHLKGKLKYSFNNLFKLTVGAELQSTHFNEDGVANQTDAFHYYFNNTYSAAFAEADVFFSNAFAGKFGVRMAHSSLFDAASLAPRLSLAYKLNKNAQLSLVYGSFYQAPQNNELKYNDDFELQEATHYILNYQYKKNNQLFRAEAFYKKYDQLVQFDAAFNQEPSNFNNNGFGYAKGLDLFWKDTRNIKYLQYWVSYSYLDTQRKFKDYPTEVMPSFATKHNASLVTKYWINGLRSQVGMTYNFASGRPYNNPNASDYMDGRTKNYHNASLNWSYLISQQKILFFSASNILGFNNTFGYDYSNTPDGNGRFDRQAIVPTAKRSFFVGFFWTISDDKTKNQLDTL